MVQNTAFRAGATGGPARNKAAGGDRRKVKRAKPDFADYRSRPTKGNVVIPRGEPSITSRSRGMTLVEGVIGSRGRMSGPLFLWVAPSSPAHSSCWNKDIASAQRPTGSPWGAARLREDLAGSGWRSAGSSGSPGAGKR